MSVLEWLMPPPTEGDRGFWSSVREALKGSHQDYTTGNLNRAILLLAIPMVLEMVLESLFAVTDVFWVGRLGANAVATVGITESMLALVFAIGLGVSMSTTAMVARRIGEKDPEDAAIAGVQAVVVGLAISLVVGIPAGIYAPELLRAMGASPEIVASGSGYARIALGGCGAIIMLFLNNAIFRGAGDAAIAMRLLWVSNIINLILDPCLIFGLGPFPRMGVTGAALATFTGRSIGVLYQFYRLLKRHGADSHPGAASALECARDVAAAARFSDGHFAICDCECKLDCAGADHLDFRSGRGCGIHDCDSDRCVLHSAVVGIEQCGGDPGGAKPGRQEAGSRGAVGLADGVLQHAVSGCDRGVLHRVCHAGGQAVCERSGGSANRRNCAADVQLRQHRVCLWNGDAAGVQRGGRHAYADDCELLRLLGAGIAAGMVAGGDDALACGRGVSVDCDCGMQHCGGGNGAFPARKMGPTADLVLISG